MNFFNKVKLFFQKPKVVIVVGAGSEMAQALIAKVLKPHFKTGKEVLIFGFGAVGEQELKQTQFLLENSSWPIVVLTHLANILPETRELVKKVSPSGFLILNSDEEILRELKTETTANKITFGFEEIADFRASDITETNFKVNYKGNIVPVWLEKVFDKEQIYAALSAFSVGVALGLNLVEISQGLSPKG